jgi:hypothetical protein
MQNTRRARTDCSRFKRCKVEAYEDPSSLNVMFEVSMAIKIQVVIFWLATPCSVVVGYQRFGAPCRRHLRASRPRRPRLQTSQTFLSLFLQKFRTTGSIQMTSILRTGFWGGIDSNETKWNLYASLLSYSKASGWLILQLHVSVLISVTFWKNWPVSLNPARKKSRYRTLLHYSIFQISQLDCFNTDTCELLRREHHYHHSALRFWKPRNVLKVCDSSFVWMENMEIERSKFEMTSLLGFDAA